MKKAIDRRTTSICILFASLNTCMIHIFQEIVLLALYLIILPVFLCYIITFKQLEYRKTKIKSTNIWRKIVTSIFQKYYYRFIRWHRTTRNNHNVKWRYTHVHFIVIPKATIFFFENKTNERVAREKKTNWISKRKTHIQTNCYAVNQIIYAQYVCYSQCRDMLVWIQSLRLSFLCLFVEMSTMPSQV